MLGTYDGNFKFNPEKSTYILFMEKSHDVADANVVDVWDSRLINPTVTELKIFNFLDNYKGTLVVYMQDHYDEYDHNDPTVALATCICNLPDPKIAGWPKFYNNWKFVASGTDILSLDLSKL
jgi:hypothetical protein